MKRYIYPLFIVLPLLFSGCLDEPGPFASDATPGLSVTYDEEVSEITFTKNPDATITGAINISGKFFVNPAAVFDRVVIIKALMDNDFKVIEESLAIGDLAFYDSVVFSISSVEALFDGLSIEPDEIVVGSTFGFRPIGILPSGDTIEVTNSVTVIPDYIAFCEIPDLALGTWVATNTVSGFSKEVELIWYSNENLYVLTDFGLDWSNWDDFWYGTMFSLACPIVNTDPVEINLAGRGWDTDEEYEMLADDGVTIEKRRLRYMPYIYKEASPVGYFDATTGSLIFDGVNLTDAWWDADSHDQVSLTFSKKP